MNNMFLIYGGFLLAFGVFYYVSFYLNKKAYDNNSKEFLQKYPNAAKVYLKKSGWIITDDTKITAVNNENAMYFQEGAKYGVYLIPGKNIVSIEATRTRPGILHKSVSTHIGNTDIEIDVKAEKSYTIYYNYKENRFVIEEN